MDHHVDDLVARKQKVARATGIESQSRQVAYVIKPDQIYQGHHDHVQHQGHEKNVVFIVAANFRRLGIQHLMQAHDFCQLNVGNVIFFVVHFESLIDFDLMNLKFILTVSSKLKYNVNTDQQMFDKFYNIINVRNSYII